jgi:glyoxylase-like metal-dependent hydrolase (beta-lactamase superfamily II)
MIDFLGGWLLIETTSCKERTLSYRGLPGTSLKRLPIDTGQCIPDWADLISQTLSASGISLLHVLLTNWHGDHTAPDLHVSGRSLVDLQAHAEHYAASLIIMAG